MFAKKLEDEDIFLGKFWVEICNCSILKGLHCQAFVKSSWDSFRTEFMHIGSSFPSAAFAMMLKVIPFAKG